jgi:hypothetical protein
VRRLQVLEDEGEGASRRRLTQPGGQPRHQRGPIVARGQARRLEQGLEKVERRLVPDRRRRREQAGHALALLGRGGFGEKPRLADALGPDHRDDAPLSRGEPPQAIAEGHELRLASHQGSGSLGPEALRAAPRRADVEHGHRLRLALHRHGLEGLVDEQVAGRLPGVRADVHVADRRLALDACGGVHRVAQHVELANHGPPDVAGRHRARVDAHVEAEGKLESDLAVVARDLPLHLECGAHRGGRPLFEAHRVAEDRHQGVAEVLVHGAAVAPHHAVEQPQAAGGDAVGLLGTELLRERREAHQVGEHHGRADPFDAAGALLGARSGHDDSPRRLAR